MRTQQERGNEKDLSKSSLSSTGPWGMRLIEKDGKVVKVYNDRPNFDHDSPSKHAPLAPRGTVFLLKDNPHIAWSPVRPRKGPQIDKLCFELTDTNGDIHKRQFPLLREAKWDDRRWISKANAWRTQTIKRTFHRDNEMRPMVKRSKYSSQEMGSLKDTIRNKIGRSGRKPTAEDWKEIAEKHNVSFSDTKIPAGALLRDKVLSKSGQVVAKRTGPALSALFNRSEEIRNVVNAALGVPLD